MHCNGFQPRFGGYNYVDILRDYIPIIIVLFYLRDHYTILPLFKSHLNRHSSQIPLNSLGQYV